MTAGELGWALVGLGAGVAIGIGAVIVWAIIDGIFRGEVK